MDAASVPREFLCALSFAVMRDPAFERSAPARVCERTALEGYISAHGKSPFTGAHATLADILPVPTLGSLIQRLFWQHEQQPSGVAPPALQTAAPAAPAAAAPLPAPHPAQGALGGGAPPAQALQPLVPQPPREAHSTLPGGTDAATQAAAGGGRGGDGGGGGSSGSVPIALAAVKHENGTVNAAEPLPSLPLVHAPLSAAAATAAPPPPAAAVAAAAAAAAAHACPPAGPYCEPAAAAAAPVAAAAVAAAAAAAARACPHAGLPSELAAGDAAPAPPRGRKRQRQPVQPVAEAQAAPARRPARRGVAAPAPAPTQLPSGSAPGPHGGSARAAVAGRQTLKAGNVQSTAGAPSGRAARMDSGKARHWAPAEDVVCLLTSSSDEAEAEEDGTAFGAAGGAVAAAVVPPAMRAPTGTQAAPLAAAAAAAAAAASPAAAAATVAAAAAAAAGAAPAAGAASLPAAPVPGERTQAALPPRGVGMQLGLAARSQHAALKHAQRQAARYARAATAAGGGSVEGAAGCSGGGSAAAPTAAGSAAAESGNAGGCGTSAQQPGAASAEDPSAAFAAAAATAATDIAVPPCVHEAPAARGALRGRNGVSVSDSGRGERPAAQGPALAAPPQQEQASVLAATEAAAPLPVLTASASPVAAAAPGTRAAGAPAAEPQPSKALPRSQQQTRKRSRASLSGGAAAAKKKPARGVQLATASPPAQLPQRNGSLAGAAGAGGEPRGGVGGPSSSAPAAHAGDVSSPPPRAAAAVAAAGLHAPALPARGPAALAAPAAAGGGSARQHTIGLQLLWSLNKAAPGAGQGSQVHPSSGAAQQAAGQSRVAARSGAAAPAQGALQAAAAASAGVEAAHTAPAAAPKGPEAAAGPGHEAPPPAQQQQQQAPPFVSRSGRPVVPPGRFRSSAPVGGHTFDLGGVAAARRPVGPATRAATAAAHTAAAHTAAAPTAAAHTAAVATGPQALPSGTGDAVARPVKSAGAVPGPRRRSRGPAAGSVGGSAALAVPPCADERAAAVDPAGAAATATPAMSQAPPPAAGGDAAAARGPDAPRTLAADAPPDAAGEEANPSGRIEAAHAAAATTPPVATAPIASSGSTPGSAYASMKYRGVKLATATAKKPAPTAAAVPAARAAMSAGAVASEPGAAGTSAQRSAHARPKRVCAHDWTALWRVLEQAKAAAAAAAASAAASGAAPGGAVAPAAAGLIVDLGGRKLAPTTPAKSQPASNAAAKQHGGPSAKAPPAPAPAASAAVCAALPSSATAAVPAAVQPRPAAPAAEPFEGIELAAPQLQLRNGTLLLPPGWRLRVGAAGVVLTDVTVCGRGTPPGRNQEGLVEVQGAGADARLQRCTVQLERTSSGGGAAKCSCVLVSAGAKAVLEDCSVSGGLRDGVLALHAGSDVRATRCAARECATSGFTASEGASMELHACTTQGAQYGYCSEDKRSSLRCVSCHAAKTKYGFNSTRGGELEAVDCVTEESTERGFSAYQANAAVIGKGSCVARACGWGFAAADGGVVRLEGECVAEGTPQGGGGYLVQGAKSRLTTLGVCRAEGCPAGAGFYAERGGCMELGPGCVARGCSTGFLVDGTPCADGSRARMLAGDGCTAESNGAQGGPTAGGFVAAKGGTLEVGADCVSRKNCEAGFLAIHPGSQLCAGGGCVAEDTLHSACAAAPVAFAATHGATLRAGERCVARRSGQHGFASMYSDSTLVAGGGCVAEHNGGTGFLASRLASLSAGPQCVASDNGEEGFCAVGGNLTVHAGRALRNASDGFIACKMNAAPQRSALQPSPMSFREANAAGVLEAEGACVAEDNAGSGFHCEDAGCRLEARGGCVTRGNEGPAGFSVMGGGMMVVQGPALASNNAGWGYLVRGKGAQLLLAPGLAEVADAGGNGKGGRSAEEGARIQEDVAEPLRSLRKRK